MLATSSGMCQTAWLRAALVVLAIVAPAACGDSGDAAPDASGDAASDVAADATTDLSPTDGKVEADAPSGDVTADTDDVPVDSLETATEESAEVPPEAGETAEGLDVSELPPGPCTFDFDCDDGDPCTADLCDAPAGKCSRAARTCDAGVDCFASAACAAGQGCVFMPVFSTACWTSEPALSADFEDGLGAWTVVDLAKNQPAGHQIVWAPSMLRAHSGTHSLYFGDPTRHDYDTGKQVAAVARSAAVTPLAGQPAHLVFWAWADVEDGDLWDVLSVTVETADAAVPVWSKAYGFPMKVWTPVDIDLSAFAGLAIRVALTFNSVEGSYNATEGLYVDDVWLLSAQTVATCATAAECDDHVACTVDDCTGGTCSHSLATACCSADLQCDDFDACTVDLCQQGACNHLAVADPLCCNQDGDCDDKNDCTSDACTKNKCAYQVLGTAGCCKADFECNDDDDCTKDVCDANHCKHINRCCKTDAECDDGDDVCTTDHCVGGNCVFQLTDVEGCCTPSLASWTFDSGVDGWTLAPLAGGVGWHVTTTGQSVSKPGALYYGNPKTWDFENNLANQGEATSPWVSLPAGVPVELSYQWWADTGWYAYTDLQVWIQASGQPDVVVWDKTYGSTYDEFYSQTLDLSAWAGQSIRVHVHFDAPDAGDNDGMGIFLDDMLLTTTCVLRTCKTASECYDGLSGTKDSCVGGSCVWQLSGTVI